jgi:hypothetical protein
LSSAKVKPVGRKAAVTGMTHRGPNVSLITLKRRLFWELGVIAGMRAEINLTRASLSVGANGRGRFVAIASILQAVDGSAPRFDNAGSVE